MAASNQIIQIKTVEEALPYFETATQNTIICFDMDNTLIMPADPAFRRGIYHESPELYAYKATLPKGILEYFIPYILLLNPSIPTSSRFPEIIETLFMKNLKVIVLSGSQTQDLLNKGFIPRLRFNILESLGYQIDQSFPEVEEIIMDHLPSHYGHYPTFYKGVLASNGHEYKAVALWDFLEKVNFRAKQVIFMDDQLHNVKELSDFFAAQHPEIDFIGLHYTLIPDAIAKEGNSPSIAAKVISAWKEAYAAFLKLYVPWQKKHPTAPSLLSPTREA